MHVHNVQVKHILTQWLERVERGGFRRHKTLQYIQERNRKRGVLFSPEDQILMGVPWSIDPHNYPVSTFKLNGKGCIIRSGRAVLQRKLGRELLPGEICDHLNGKPKDNQRENVRATTQTHNVRNVHVRRSQSGFVGVWQRRGGKWQAAIQVNKKSIKLGVFADPEDAARAYNAAAEKHGFLTRNVIPETT